MDSVIKLLTYTHVLAGILSLIVAPIAMVVRKGASAHRLWGKIFFWSMAWICFSAIVISVYKWIPFLLLLAVFSFYASYSGYRALYQKQIHLGKGVKWYDWTMAIVSGAFMLGFIVYGIYLVSTNQLGYFGYLSIGFGIGGSLTVWGELKNYIKPPTDKHNWLFAHLGSMLGGFIASVTAFSTQTMNFLPGAIQWIWPSLVGVPFIILWGRYYRRKLKAGTPITQLLEFKR